MCWKMHLEPGVNVLSMLSDDVIPICRNCPGVSDAIRTSYVPSGRIAAVALVFIVFCRLEFLSLKRLRIARNG